VAKSEPAFECLVVVVHHCGIAKNRPRGHTSLAGANDAQIAVERDKEGHVIATVEHMKDAEAGAVITEQLANPPVSLALDGATIERLTRLVSAWALAGLASAA
jgi:hypothetical protein